MVRMDAARNLGVKKHEYLEIMKLFLNQSASDLKTIQSAMKNEDHKAFARAVHSIKGAAINLGLTTIYETTMILETKSKNKNLKAVVDEVKLLKNELSEMAQLLETT